MQDPDVFLRQEVESATPAKLRWLLIRKAIGLCQAVEQLWLESRPDEANQWVLRIREIFGELLAGVTDAENPAAQPVTSIYIFMLLLLDEVEKSRDPDAIKTMIEILEIEFGTWSLFVEQENQAGRCGLDFPGTPSPNGGGKGFVESTEWLGLNVEA